jgi:AraC-like DNA-binding protein
MSNKRARTVHVGPAWRLLLRDLGVDETAVLRRAGQPATLFDGDGTHVSLDEFFALHDAVEAESGDPTIALRAGEVVSIELFDPALFAAICARDMNTAATRLGEFKRLVGAFSLDVEVGRDETTIRYRCKHRRHIPWTRGLTELVFLTALTRRATRHRVVPVRVEVQQQPPDPDPYAAWFGCTLEPGDAWALVLAPGDGRRPFLTHNAAMWESFEPGLRRRMAEADGQRPTSEQVADALFELLPSGRTRMKDAAKELGVGARTLQRRLADEGTTWLEVLNGTRERLARHYLSNSTMSPAEVSFLLGFEDPNSLFRAFQRWTGTTPESWRSGATRT